MSTSNDEAALTLVKETSDPIHHMGSAMYLSPDVFGWAAEWGWANPFAFYFGGRGAMVGDVDPAVVAAAFGWFEPNVVAAMYSEGIGVAGAKAAADRMAEATALWGRKHWAEVPGIADIASVTEEFVGGLEGSACPIFAGWRAAPAAEDAPGRTAQLVQILREWRGGIHLVATTAVGLSPLEAILTNEGEGQAKFFGWSEPFPPYEAIKHKHDEAEEITDRRLAEVVARTFSADRYQAFEAGVATLRAATP